MIKAVLLGLWSCIVAVGAAYMGLMWSQSAPNDAKALAKPVKLTHVPVRSISVPVAADGRIKGYVVARLGYVSRADDLKKAHIKPEVFLFDAVLSAIFQRKLFDIDSIDQTTLAEFSQHVKARVNAQLGTEIVQQVVAEELGFVPIEQARGRTVPSSTPGFGTAPKSGTR